MLIDHVPCSMKKMIRTCQGGMLTGHSDQLMTGRGYGGSVQTEAAITLDLTCAKSDQPECPLARCTHTVAGIHAQT